MEQGRGWTARLAPVALVVIAFVASACAAPVGERAAAPVADTSTTTTTVPAEPTDVVGFVLPDITARRITTSDLTAMLPEGPGSLLDRTNEGLVTAAVLDREDESSDIVLFGRVTGVGFEYDGPPTAYVWIDVLPDVATASDYLADAAGDIVKGVGGSHAPGTAVSEPSGFAIDVADEAIGLVGTLSDGSTETMVLARAGRLVLFASQIHEDPAVDARVAVQYLAEDTLSGIVASLTDSEAGAIAEAPAYRFESVVTVADDRGTTRITTQGIVDGRDRSCTIRIEAPDATVTHQLVELDGLTWWKQDSASFARVSSGNLEVAGLLVRCPGWPLGLEASGLEPLVAAQPDPARHHVNDVDAAGYQSDGVGLAAVLGVGLGDSTVNAFSFWIADEGSWLVELTVSLSGSATDRALIAGPGIALDGEGTVTLRHRVFEIGTLDESVVPPS